jgi:hypothetical protein
MLFIPSVFTRDEARLQLVEFVLESEHLVGRSFLFLVEFVVALVHVFKKVPLKLMYPLF